MPEQRALRLWPSNLHIQFRTFTFSLQGCPMKLIEPACKNLETLTWKTASQIMPTAQKQSFEQINNQIPLSYLLCNRSEVVFELTKAAHSATMQIHRTTIVHPWVHSLTTSQDFNDFQIPSGLARATISNCSSVPQKKANLNFQDPSIISVNRNHTSKLSTRTELLCMHKRPSSRAITCCSALPYLFEYTGSD